MGGAVRAGPDPCSQYVYSARAVGTGPNRIINNNKRYYCASKYEIENLSKPAYDYAPEVLRLTGLARYDGLVNRDQKQILIAPTWRAYIAMPPVMGSTRPYNPEFKQTDYFKIFQSLLENERLQKAAEEAGYRIIYCIRSSVRRRMIFRCMEMWSFSLRQRAITRSC